VIPAPARFAACLPQAVKARPSIPDIYLVPPPGLRPRANARRRIPVRNRDLGCHTPQVTSGGGGFDCGGRRSPMRQRQPLSELLCCFVRSRSVKRHRCRRDARRAHQLGAPPIAGGHYLDEECAPADGFLKTMNSHLVMSALKTRISRRRACVPLKVRSEARMREGDGG
jgi:hypothetical protein